MIEYRSTDNMKPGVVLEVYLDGRHIGNIMSKYGGYAYNPLNTDDYGDWFEDLEDCKRSLEDDD